MSHGSIPKSGSKVGNFVKQFESMGQKAPTEETKKTESKKPAEETKKTEIKKPAEETKKTEIKSPLTTPTLEQKSQFKQVSPETAKKEDVQKDLLQSSPKAQVERLDSSQRQPPLSLLKRRDSSSQLEKSKTPKTPSETSPKRTLESSPTIGESSKTEGVTVSKTGPSSMKGLSKDEVLSKFNDKDGSGFFATTITTKGYQFEGCDLHIKDIKESFEKGKLGGVPAAGAKRVSHVKASQPQNLLGLDGYQRAMATLKDVDSTWQHVVDAFPEDASSNKGFQPKDKASFDRSKSEVLGMLNKNLEAQSEKCKSSSGAWVHNEVRLFGNAPESVAAFVWKPLPDDKLAGVLGAKGNHQTWEKSKHLFQDYVDGICNGPKDGKGSSVEQYCPNPRDSFPIFKYEVDEKTKAAKLTYVDTIVPNHKRGGFDPKTGQLDSK
jgi:hypothetical protein